MSNEFIFLSSFAKKKISNQIQNDNKIQTKNKNKKKSIKNRKSKIKNQKSKKGRKKTKEVQKQERKIIRNISYSFEMQGSLSKLGIIFSL